MARVVKEHNQRKNEILDTAQSLFLNDGYENTTIEMILDSVGIAKGTFYHYFKSKIELLDEIISRMIVNTLPLLKQTVNSSELNALEKLNKIFSLHHEFKFADKGKHIASIKEIYKDENILYLDKLIKKQLELVSHEIKQIIVQGIEEGIFHSPSPSDTADVVLMMLSGFKQMLAYYIFKTDDEIKDSKKLMLKIQTYEISLDRVLGIKEGSVILFDKK